MYNHEKYQIVHIITLNTEKEGDFIVWTSLKNKHTYTVDTVHKATSDFCLLISDVEYVKSGSYSWHPCAAILRKQVAECDSAVAQLHAVLPLIPWWVHWTLWSED